jgi:predicted O-methyltransferase YrrM
VEKIAPGVMKNALDYIRRVEPVPVGLLSADCLATLRGICERVRPLVIVEVGTFLGMGSTRVFCEAANLKDGLVICIDTCTVDMATHRSVKLPHHHLQILASNFREPLYRNAALLRARSIEAAPLLSVVPDIVFIDGGHSESEVSADIQAWLPLLRPGGVICGDDYCEKYPGVERAVRWLLPDHQVEGRIWHSTIQNA